MIHSHLYARNADTPLFAAKEHSDPSCLLSKGTWLGVVDKTEGWYKVIGIQCEGWVRTEDVEPLSPFNLHVQWKPGEPIQYVGTAA